MGKIDNLYLKVYGLICGEHPNLRPLHYQWLAANVLYADLRRIIPDLHGHILDVGCGDKPYQTWFQHVESYIGIDVYDGPHVDKVIYPGQAWPLSDAAFDAIFCTQVLEHISDLDHVLSEMKRVLKPGGTLVVTAPFVYHEHLRPHDYRRSSVHGIRQFFENDYEIVLVKSQGRIGNTLGLLFLNWITVASYQSLLTRIMMGLAMPLWIIFCTLVNGMAVLLNLLDSTGAFYSNVLLVARKRQSVS